MKQFKFTKNKFLTFAKDKQHKKCAEMLSQIYQLLQNENEIKHYNEVQKWMGLPELKENDKKIIADKYHGHLNLANQYVREHHLLPQITNKDKNVPCKNPLPIDVYLDNIRSAHNVGSIIRTVEAFQLGTIYFSPTTPFIDNLKVQKTSMETYKWVKCRRCNTIETTKTIIALETSKETIDINEFIFPEPPFTIAVGNEEYGCSDKILQHANYIVEIPLVGKKNSLNVANAFAIVAAKIRGCR